MNCPYCNERTHRVYIDNAQGRRWYDECYECGWCSDENYEKGYDHDDPDREVDERWVSDLS